MGISKNIVVIVPKESLRDERSARLNDQPDKAVLAGVVGQEAIPVSAQQKEIASVVPPLQ